MTIEPTIAQWGVLEHMERMGWFADKPPMQELGEDLMKQALMLDEEA